MVFTDRDAMAGVFASCSCFRQRELEELLRAAGTAGIRGVELGVGVNCSAPLLPILRRAAREFGFVYRIHNYFPPPPQPFVLNLASDDSTIAKASMTLCREAVGLCAELEIPYFSVHAGFCVHSTPQTLGRSLVDLPRIEPDKARDLFVRRTRELAREAAALGIGIAIENNVVAPFNLVKGRNELLLGASAEDMLGLLNSIGETNVGALVDIGHLHVSAAALGFDYHEALLKLSAHALAVHVSRNDGGSDQHQPLRENDKFTEAIALFDRNVDLILEAHRLDEVEIVRQLALLSESRSSETGRFRI